MSRRYAQRVRALRLDSTGWREYCRPANTFHAQAAPLPYSHSIVPGGLLVTSSTTRFTSATSLVMRVEMRSSTS